MKGLSIGLTLIIFMFVSIVYFLVLIPPGLLLKYGIIPLISKDFIGLILGLSLVLVDLWVLLLSAVIIPGIFWRIMNLRYTGVHALDFSDKMVRNWLITHMIYIPTAVTLDLFHLYPLKAIHVQVFGAKLGRDVVVGSLITDPSLLEVEDYANLGGFSLILGHALELGKVVFAKVLIERGCGVGTKSMVLPGAVMEENAFLGAQSLLPKFKRIPRGEKYGGVPAKKIISPPQTKGVTE